MTILDAVEKYGKARVRIINAIERLSPKNVEHFWYIGKDFPEIDGFPDWEVHRYNPREHDRYLLKIRSFGRKSLNDMKEAIYEACQDAPIAAHVCICKFCGKHGF